MSTTPALACFMKPKFQERPAAVAYEHMLEKGLRARVHFT